MTEKPVSVTAPSDFLINTDILGVFAHWTELYMACLSLLGGYFRRSKPDTLYETVKEMEHK